MTIALTKFVRRAGLGLAGLAVAVAALAPAWPAQAAGEVNLYSYRQPFLIEPFLADFTKETGIKVNVVFAKKGVLERLKREGANSPADAILTVDIARLKAHVDEGLLQPVKSPVVEKNIPAAYRDPDGMWVGLTLRTRLLAVSKDRVKEGEITRYEDLADPKWKGKICTRPGGHVYNRALIASLIAHHGEQKAEELVGKIAANFARKPQGNDRGQAKAVYEGVCDVAIINNYYFGKMKFNDEKPEQKKWAESVRLVFPNQGDRGSHVNVSGAGITKHAKNKENAVKLIEYLSSPAAQRMYAEKNFEYPVNPSVEWSEELVSWGRFKADSLSLRKVADLSPAAQKLADRVGW